MAVTADALTNDSENLLFHKLKAEKQLWPYLISRTQFNRRRRALHAKMNQIQELISIDLRHDEQHFIIDSMPIPICKMARAGRIRICKEYPYSAPNTGYTASQKAYFHGYKLHLTASVSGVIVGAAITKASVHDVHYLSELKKQVAHCEVIGDKGYISAKEQLDLFNTAEIRLQVPMRSNQINAKPLPMKLARQRKRIETMFSQFCKQLGIQRNLAKSFYGFQARIKTKILAFTTLQLLNYSQGKPLNQLQFALA